MDVEGSELLTMASIRVGTASPRCLTKSSSACRLAMYFFTWQSTCKKALAHAILLSPVAFSLSSASAVASAWPSRSPATHRCTALTTSDTIWSSECGRSSSLELDPRSVAPDGPTRKTATSTPSLCSMSARRKTHIYIGRGGWVGEWVRRDAISNSNPRQETYVLDVVAQREATEMPLVLTNPRVDVEQHRNHFTSSNMSLSRPS